MSESLFWYGVIHDTTILLCQYLIPKPRRKTPAAAKGHKLPEPIPEGFEVSDTFKKGWKVGTKIGSGGFGTVYFGMYCSEYLFLN
ncbi:UNVERIFIED_CONTAM: hypothetical protein NCL1_47693 [Trichonephila clavipes]